MATFPYPPGLLAFREVDILTEALSLLTVTPDVLVCDGQGIAHPLCCGLANHLGVTSSQSSDATADPFKPDHALGERRRQRQR